MKKSEREKLREFVENDSLMATEESWDEGLRPKVQIIALLDYVDRLEDALKHALEQIEPYSRLEPTTPQLSQLGFVYKAVTKACAILKYERQAPAGDES